VAYSDVSDGWANRAGIALPFRFRGTRPKVIVSANGKTTTCEIVDVGPWNTNDPYWITNARPQAESGTDMSGRRTNGAGIDLTPAAARAIGLDGKGQIIWFFDSTGAEPMSDATTTVPQLDLLNLPQLHAVKQFIDSLIKQGGGATPAVPNLNLTQLADINKQLEAFVQLASTIIPILSVFIPQLKILLPILPVLNALLKMGDTLAQAGNDPAKIADALAAQLKDVAQQVQALKLPGQS
jgi:hypothetical protein